MPRRVTLRFCADAGAARAMIAIQSQTDCQPPDFGRAGHDIHESMREMTRPGWERPCSISMN